MLDKLREIGCDIDGALERMLSDEDFLLECMEETLGDEDFENLKNAVIEKDVEKAFAAAHTLKGICGNTGITPLYDMITPIVEELRKGQSKGILEKVEELLKTKEDIEKLFDK